MTLLKILMTGRAGFGWMFCVLIVGSVLGPIVSPSSSSFLGFVIMCGLLLGYGLVAFATVRTIAKLAQNNDDLFSILGLIAGLVFLMVAAAAQFATFLLPQNPALFLPSDRISKVSVSESELTISGPIDYQVLTDLRSVLESETRFSTIVLNSEGGNVIAGRSIGLLIESRGLNVHVENNCFSACTLIFAGGKVRTVGGTAQLGFHGYAFDHQQRVQTLDIESVEAKDRRFLVRRGFEESFVNRIYLIEPDDLWKPTLLELSRAGVITH